jgi:2-keto-4-pentenoate hydratase/2-oxohepta-3-ene-1,7-dioic acid hydratase in catechol pathway
VPVIIMKPPNVHNGLFSTVEIPPIAQDEEIDFGVTLAIIIGQQCHDVAEEDSLDVVFGYTCGNERTARKVEQKYGSTYAKSRSFSSPLQYAV